MRDSPQFDSTPDFRALFQSLPDLYLVLSTNLSIIGVSDAYLCATMTKRDEILGRKVFEVFPDNPSDPSATGARNLRASLARVLLDKTPDTMAVQKYDIRKPQSEGGAFEERYWSPVNSPVIGPDHNVAYIIHRVKDVTEFVRLKRQGTEQKKLTEELRTHAGRMEAEIYQRAAEVQKANQRLEAANLELHRAKEGAERASTFKDQFLSTMSHELRTPLNAVLGFSDLLADESYGPLNERQQRYINHIRTGGKHLLSLINDILDLSKIEAGRMELVLESVPVERVFGEVLSAMRPLADKKCHLLSKDAPPGLLIRADSTRFKQILMNLLGNAIKFTPSGGRIGVSARLIGDRVRVEVRDNGPGIPPDEQKRIFEAFYRLRESGRKTEGTGLGLAITHRLVELHGGKLDLASEFGTGSCFYFSLPAAVERPRLVNVKPLATLAGSAVVLVIEDDRISAHLIQSQLTSAGYEVRICDQPGEAVEFAAQLQPIAITLGIVKKPREGWELLSQLKRDPRTAKIPMLVVSIVDQPSIGAMLGADEYLLKPLAKATLLEALGRHVRSQVEAAPAKTILVVEDDLATREFIVEILNGEGYDVVTASDGAQARTRVSASLPELVILDLILPDVNGFELLDEWRACDRTAHLSVFVLTSKDLSPEDRAYIHDHADALLHKDPRWQDALLSQLASVVALSKQEMV
jgi:signal transduction histidine kinase/CheY-like chemotaxis protein